MKAVAGWVYVIAVMLTGLAWSQDERPRFDVRGRDARDVDVRDQDRDPQLRREDERGGERRRADPALRLPTSLDRGASINPELLTVVRDNTLGLLAEERDLYFRMLQLGHETPLARQEDFAADFREQRWQDDPLYSKAKLADFPTFDDLFRNPGEYRGRPVSLRGVLRKLTKFDPGKNSLGINEAYEGWLYTEDGQSNPTVVVFTSKPQKLAVGGDLNEEVRLTGYFLKMYGYDAQDVTRKAPLLLAGEVEWRPSSPKYVTEAVAMETYFCVGLIVFLLGYAVWQSNRREMIRRIRAQPEVDFSRFPSVEYSSVTVVETAETDDA